ncbi:MAG: MATE family efflux transporter, partial [Muribaculaceae bacterium]|nr:MATE family efflux transporter [Muribaculaceae bacterium]
GLQPIIGYNYGARQMHRLHKALWLAAGASTAICVLGSVAGLLWPEIIVRAFTTDSYLTDVSVNCLHLSLWAFSTVGIQIIATCLFQSIGASAKAIFLSLTRQVIFLIPLLLWLPSFMGVDGVWTSFPLSDLLATVVTVAMVWWQLRAMKLKSSAA